MATWSQSVLRKFLSFSAVHAGRKVALVSALLPIAFAQQPQPPAAGPTTPATARTMLNQYCVGCHNQKLKTAGVTLDTMDTSHVGSDARTWERVLRKLSVGEMPPPKLPRPAAPVVHSFTGWLQGELDTEAALHPNPGHPTVHRLNRAEYSNAVRDLLALDIKPGAKLPADDTGYGFDNIGDVLSLSPMLIERYISTARLVSRMAVGTVDVKPETNQFLLSRADAGRRGRMGDDLPFDSSGGISIPYDFPVDAEYIIKIKTPPSVPTPDSGAAPEPHFYEVRMPVKAGAQTLAVTFLAENALPEQIPTPGRKPNAAAIVLPTSTAHLDLRLDGKRLKLFEVPYRGFSPQLSSVTIAGPFNITGPGDTPSRRKIFVCSAQSSKEEEPCARRILANLAHYAYRRPVTDADLKPLLAFYEKGRKEASFDKGIQKALEAMLVSPDFLFRIERDPAGAAPGTVHSISDYELASRLSFFLWSSIPDDELLTLASKGKLCDPAVLKAQVTRMLADDRSKAFVSNFAGQWLYLRNLAQVRPDPDLFPDYDTALRDSFARETELFVATPSCVKIGPLRICFPPISHT